MSCLFDRSDNFRIRFKMTPVQHFTQGWQEADGSEGLNADGSENSFFHCFGKIIISIFFPLNGKIIKLHASMYDSLDGGSSFCIKGLYMF